MDLTNSNEVNAAVARNESAGTLGSNYADALARFDQQVPKWREACQRCWDLGLPLPPPPIPPQREEAVWNPILGQQVTILHAPERAVPIFTPSTPKGGNVIAAGNASAGADMAAETNRIVRAIAAALTAKGIEVKY